MCFVLLVGCSTIVERTCILKKELSLFVAAPNRQNFRAVIFSNGRLLHPPSPVLPICLQIARARPKKTLKAITFSNKKNWISIQIN